MPDDELRVGPRISADGGAIPFRGTRTGGLAVADLHGKRMEASTRNKIFSVSTAAAGTTAAAANATPPAAAAATVLTLYNPQGSGVNLSIIRGVVQHISGTPAAGGVTWCFTPDPAPITATENAAPIPAFVGKGRSVARGYTQTALTGGSVHVLYRHFGSAPFAGALAAGAGPLGHWDETDGEITVPPGYALSIAVGGAGTSHVLAAAIVYEEIPIAT